MKKKTIFTLVLSVLWINSYAELSEDQNDYSTVMETLVFQSEKDKARYVMEIEGQLKDGDPAAMYNMYLNHYFGFIFKKDYGKAKYWLMLSAEKQNVEAYMSLGKYFRRGKPELAISPNREKELYYFEEAGKLGDSMGVFNYKDIIECGMSGRDGEYC